MSYSSVMVMESTATYAEGLRSFKKNAQPGLEAAKKAGILNSYSVVQTGKHSGLAIFHYPNKTARNKFSKAMAASRDSQAEELGMQIWIHHGPVKISG